MSTILLIDAMPIKLSLDESEEGKVIARGEFARCDVPTQNGRRYPRSLYEREVKKLQETINRRRCFGELDHPADGKTMLQRVSHLITKLSIEKDGRVMGEAEILDTPSGKTLKAILSAGAEAGVSSRGFGSTKPNSAGSQDVGDDFVLRTFDFVADPAMQTAYPTIYNEDIEQPEFTVEDLKASFPELVQEATDLSAQDEIAKIVEAEREKVKAEMEEVFTSKLAEALADVRGKLKEDVREEYESAESAQAHVALHKIGQIISPLLNTLSPEESVLEDALVATESRVSELENELAEAKNMLKITGFAMHVESKIGSHSKKESIKRLLGKVSHYESTEQLDERIEEITDEFSVVVEAERIREHASNDQLQLQVESLEAAVEDLQEANQRLKGQLKGALSESNNAKVSAYKQQRASSYTNSEELLSLLEEAGSETQIDRVIDQYGRKHVADQGLESLRQRVKRGSLRQDSTNLDEGTRNPSSSLDVSFSEIKALAGI